MINNYLGMVLLSFGYAFGECGWVGLLLLAVLAVLSWYTGVLIIESYRTLEASGEKVPSYARIGEATLGAVGKWFVIGSSSFEIFFALVAMNVTVWRNATLLLPMVDPSLVTGGFIALSLTTNWLKVPLLVLVPSL